MIIQDYKVKEIAFCTYKELLENDYLPVIPNQDVITNFLLKKAEKNPRFGEKMKWENLKNIKQEYDNLYYHNSKGNMYCMRYDVQSKMAILYRIKSPSHYGKYDELYVLKAEYPETDWGYLENQLPHTIKVCGL